MSPPLPAPLPSAPSKRHWFCEVCDGWRLPKRPHWKWRAAEIGTWVAMLGILATASKGPGLLALPIVCLMAGALFGPLREAAGADARCPGCNRYIFPPKPPRR